jgi:homoserine kinase type II
MAQYTTLNQQEIEIIASEFSIKNIHSFNILNGGSENTNYILKTENDNYVLTICEQKTEQKARELALLLEHLEKHQFESSKIIRTVKKQPISFWNKKPLMIKKFLDGTVYEKLPNHLLELAGSELGKLHKIEAPKYLSKQANFGKEQFINVRKYAADSAFETWLNEKLKSVSPYLSKDLPKALIHSDLFSNNVVIAKDEQSATIMDFEEAVYYYRIFDIGMTIIGSCRDNKIIDNQKVKALLKGYIKENQFSTLEIEALKAFTIYAGAAMTFWRHLNFNYTEPTPELFNHYLELQTITNYIEALPLDYFHKIIASIDTTTSF